MTCSRPRCGCRRGDCRRSLRRWRRTGYAATGRLGLGPGWCWLTRDGMTATGLGFPAVRPALGRLAHIRAVLAARLWLETSPGWASGHAWWHSERRLRAGQPTAGRGGHVADAEIHWPSIPGSRYAGQVWAVEVELTPKPIARTSRIMGELLTSMQYSPGDLPDRPGRPARREPGRGLAPARRAAQGHGPGPARHRVPPGAAAMTIWSWTAAGRGLVAAPQGGQGGRVAAAVSRCVIAAWPLTLVVAGRVRDGVVAGLAARPGCAAPPPGRCPEPLVWLPGPVRAGPHLAGGGADPGPRVGTRLAASTRPALAAAPHVRAARPGHDPGRARPGRRGVGVAELRHHHRPGRQ